MLKTPRGLPAGDTDRIMLLSEWSALIRDEGKDIILAGMGRPSFPVHPDLLSIIAEDVTQLQKHATHARRLLDKSLANITEEQSIDQIAQHTNAIIGYENPQGKLNARKAAAKALSNWYNITITPDNLLFTTGNAGGLFDIFTMINHKNPNGRIVTPFPFYSLYKYINYRMNNLHPIHVMNEPGYRLTAKALKESITAAQKAAEEDGHSISAFLFCDPNNPLGTVVPKEEWIKIAEVISSVPDVPVIFDGAYAEMIFEPEKRTSLLEVADSDLRKRIIHLRSGTKAMSVPGLRMAVTIAFDQEIMERLIQTNIDTSGHPVTLMQDAFAKMLDILNKPEEIKTLINHYKPQVELVYQRTQQMGANMPDSQYKPESTFYVVGDFSDLLGTELHAGAYKAIGEKKLIENDEELCYDLLFRNGVMIAPLSYCGLDGENQAFMRITCSGGYTLLNKLMDILADRLFSSRMQKIEALLNDNTFLLKTLKNTKIEKPTIQFLQEKLLILEKTEFNEINKDQKAFHAKQILDELRSLKIILKDLTILDPQIKHTEMTKKIVAVH